MTDLEAQRRPPRCVLVTKKTVDAELTAAFHNPCLLSNSEADFIARNKRFQIASEAVCPPNLNDRQAILIGRELRWLGICGLALAGTIVCVVVGVWVGFWTGNVDPGINASAALATIFNSIAAFAF